MSTTTLDIVCQTINSVQFCTDPITIYVTYLLDLAVIMLVAFLTYKFIIKIK